MRLDRPQENERPQPTHKNASGNVCGNALAERLQAFLLGSPEQACESVAVSEPLRRRLGTIRAHANQNDLGRVAYESCDATRNGSAGDVGAQGQLRLARVSQPLLGQNAVKTEPSGGVGALAEYRGRETSPERGMAPWASASRSWFPLRTDNYEKSLPRSDNASQLIPLPALLNTAVGFILGCQKMSPAICGEMKNDRGQRGRESESRRRQIWSPAVRGPECLSASLKALVNAPFARSGPLPAPGQAHELFQSIARDASKRNVGARSWLAISTATTFTLNSPDSLPVLHRVASSDSSLGGVKAAEFIREVGLKCISFNGIPRTINCLNAFHASLPQDITSKLSTKPSRQPTPENLEDRLARGRGLWDSVYRPYEDKLYEKLALAHPDLPTFILSDNYAGLLSDPPIEQRGTLANVGRVYTSMVAVSCLRAQTGVGPQVLSHVFGLRKALEDGTFRQDKDGESEETVQWLASDEGSEWILNTVDSIVKTMGGSTFAPPLRESKL
ncbi:Dol-P-Man:Man(5)GlcNAc(2)-PP-Dol alpha-1,3-mannosyltransferase [Paramyrothecium foliicola]|nr:Dol-P-Man:Man(5)GlcNAc(2)-PP-Dol alpha-1,3-mannosyltransferase [Paramyrothecium foliicola]